MRHPIWSCSVRGFACHRRYRRRGALLPHLFTLTRRVPGSLIRSPKAQIENPVHLEGVVTCSNPTSPLRSSQPDTRLAVFFLCHYSVKLPCPGVTRRTALRSSDFPPFDSPLSRLAERRSSEQLRRLIIAYATRRCSNVSSCAGSNLNTNREPSTRKRERFYPSTSCLMPYCSSFL